MKIAILGTEYLNEYLKKTIALLDLYCETEIFIYYNYNHVIELYKLLEDKFDGFITTGPGPFQAIKDSVPNCKPINFFYCSESNYYKTFLEVIYRYQDWNFEYGYFDFCDYLCPDQESSLVTYLKNGTFKEWLEKNNDYISKLSIADLNYSSQQKLKKHIKLWKEGKIKYSLSRMSPIMPEVLKAGVNCYYIPFSAEDMKAGFEKLTNEILLIELKSNKPASIDVVVSEIKNNFFQKQDIVKRLIIAFTKKNLCDFIIRDTKQGVRISANYKTVEKFTKEFAVCILGNYIRENCDFPVFIGYGIDKDLSKAEFKAESASKESRVNGGVGSYLVNEKGDLISLFEDGNNFFMENDISPYIRELSDRTGMSTLTIRKLITALKVTGTEEVTAQELARVLHITLRSANRMIATLIRYNLVKLLYTKQINTKGRPSKVYNFLIDIKEK